MKRVQVHVLRGLEALKGPGTQGLPLSPLPRTSNRSLEEEVEEGGERGRRERKVGEGGGSGGEGGEGGGGEEGGEEEEGEKERECGRHSSSAPASLHSREFGNSC